MVSTLIVTIEENEDGELTANSAVVADKSVWNTSGVAFLVSLRQHVDQLLEEVAHLQRIGADPSIEKELGVGVSTTTDKRKMN